MSLYRFGVLVLGILIRLGQLQRVLSFNSQHKICRIFSQGVTRQRLERHNHCSVLSPCNTAALIDSSDILSCEREMRGEFARYIFLRDFIDGLIPLADVHPITALVVGFRRSLVKDSDDVKQNERLAPSGWENLTDVPNLIDLSDEYIEMRMMKDLPGDEGGVDVLIESLAGVEMSKMMKESSNAAEKRRVLVAKWLYVHNFFGEEFPATSRFVPFHLRMEDDDD